MSKLLEKALAIHSSPAICGIKASNLICLDYSNSIYDEIEELNKQYPKLSFYILRKCKNKILILVYRKDVFKRHLYREENIKFLQELGYDTNSVIEMLSYLKLKMTYEEFPHEIGIFLGYDLSDVKGFIKGESCLYVGYWKVYSDVYEKIKLFNKFTRCKNIVNRLVDGGMPLERFMR